MEMRIVIVGAGDTGIKLAKRLSTRHQVLLLEREFPELSDIDEIHPLADIKKVHFPESDVADREGGPGLLAFKGDGTSRLVLKELYHDDINCALVAVAGGDKVNLEVCRLGKAIGYEPVAAMMHDRDYAVHYAAEHINPLERTQLVVDEIERNLRHKGAVVPRGVGLGKGELVEIRLVGTSPIIGRPLKDLRPHRWRVSAIFRGDELIVPMGDSEMQADDRVLLVGDPVVLSTVQEYLRLGKPQFPQPYGPNVITLEFGRKDEDLLREAEAFAEQTEAVHVVRGMPADAVDWSLSDDDSAEDAKGRDDEDRTVFALPHPQDEDFAQAVKRNRPGVVVTRARRRPWLARATGQRGVDAEICDRLNRPVLIARGTYPYKRILLPVSYSDLNIRAAEVALDLTRQMHAELTAMNVDLPKFISGLAEEDVHEEVVPIRRLCELYEVTLDYRHAWGNPVRKLVAEASRHDLVVVARRPRRVDTYWNADVALRIARQAPCSVLVLTLGEHD
ncbi:MAG: TrkA C-terminal domain-containing protein [bacterium]